MASEGTATECSGICMSHGSEVASPTDEDPLEQLRHLGVLQDRLPHPVSMEPRHEAGHEAAYSSSTTSELVAQALNHHLPGMANFDSGDVSGLWKGANPGAVMAFADETAQLHRSSKKGGDHLKEGGCDHTRIFKDPEEMKAEVRRHLLKSEYNVKVYYKTKGIWRFIATNPTFEIITLIIIGLNSLWLWIDSDLNHSDVLLEADWGFQLGEHLFCSFFVFEWTARFLSFAEKKNCAKDAWFVFDSILVGLMVFETWIMTLILMLTAGSGGGMGSTSVLRLLRLMRLTRISRLARLLRACPELLFMIKGMMAATRGVFFTMLMLFFILYVFAVVMRLLSKDTPIGDRFFPYVHKSMYFLGIHGALLDDVGPVMEALTAESPPCAVAYGFVIVLAALTMMNMLVGVLCEVVSAVASSEKEELAVTLVRSKMQGILKQSDCDITFGDGAQISLELFKTLMRHPDTGLSLKDVGVDVATLVDYADIIFQSDANGKCFDRCLTLEEFMDVVLQLRDTNNATVKDVTNLRKFIHNQNNVRNQRLQKLDDRLSDLEESHENSLKRQELIQKKVKMLRLALEPVLLRNNDGLRSVLEAPHSRSYNTEPSLT